ncbi:RNA polymerase sigma factor [Fictibacillus aquaticus]|uniref:RNA polymerase sigma factor n=1 Tax=Fictibacillus aquaticus TaxID=2021314 RepID=UPI0023E354D9|nr:RNA polymerase sigma factor [Fictibacillus aquaticus]
MVQDTFVMAIKKLAMFKGKSHPKTWLISIARNLVINRYRKNKVWDRIKHFLAPEKPASNQIEEQTLKNLANSQLYDAILKLAPPFKEVIILRGILEFSPKETSSILNCSPNKVNVMFHRSLKKLQVLLEKEGFTHERYSNYSG